MPMKRANDDHGAGALFPNDCKFPGELARILHGDQHGILALPEIAPAAHPGGGVGAPCVIGKPLVPAFVDQRYDIPCPGMQQAAALDQQFELD